MDTGKSKNRDMGIQSQGVLIIVGNYGSGKTEVAVNLAIYRRRAGVPVNLADLDLVNPYFRTREVRRPLTALGVKLVLPPEGLLHADLPILSPLVAGVIRNPGELTIIDVGGNPVGAKVLSALADAFQNRSYSMLQVVNPLRPQTDTISGCMTLRREIEAASRLTVNGWIGNAHLIDATTLQDILTGHDFVSRLARRSGVPLKFIAAARQYGGTGLGLAISRQLVPPWKKAGKIH